MKNKNITVLSLVTAIASTSLLDGISLSVRAYNENEQEIMLVTNQGVKQGKEIYVKTFEGNGGNGSIERPYNSFTDAYQNAADGDTIVLLNTVTIQNDGNGSMDKPFEMNKKITFKGMNENSTLFSRVPIQLGNDVIFDNISFTSSKVYLNGYILNMKNVKRNNHSNKRPIIFGGSFKDTKKNGNKSQLIVDGAISDPIEFDKIYAGNEHGVSSIPVSLYLNKGVSVLNGVDASGLSNEVSSKVEIHIGNVNIKQFINQHRTYPTELYFHGFSAPNGVVINEYHHMVMENSYIKVKNDNEFFGVSGKLELKGNSKLDLRQKTTRFVVNDLYSEKGSMIVLNKEVGRIYVINEFHGEFELRTPEVGDPNRSGPVKLYHHYINYEANSTGNVILKPHFTQPNIIKGFDEYTNTKGKLLYFKEKPISNPISKLEIKGNKRVNILEEEHSFSLITSDKNGNDLTYVPIYDIQLIDPTGKNMDTDSVEMIHDLVTDTLVLYLYDDSIPEGYYTAVITDTVTNQKFNVQLEFHKNKQQSTYQVKFHANHGFGSMNNQKFIYGEEQKLFSNSFTRKGYTFNGWATSENGNIAYQDGQLVSNLTNTNGEIVDLYAQWIANSYVIEFNANGGFGKMNPLSMNYDSNQKINNNVFTREGYNFKGWSTKPYGEVVYTDGQEVKNLTDQVNGKVVLYAIWEKNEINHHSSLKIEAENQELEIGDFFNPLEAIVVYDENNKKVTLDHSNIVENTVNLSKAGIYHITYKLTDKNGINVIKTIQVTVKAKNSSITTESHNKPTNSNGIKNKVESLKTGVVSRVGVFSFMFLFSLGLVSMLIKKRHQN